MTRQIKFRAWDKDSKSMHKVYVWKFQAASIYLKPRTNELKMLNHLEIMQFTGLKDKNGKEIYEGDIVWDTDYPKEAWAIYSIDYDKGYFGMTDTKHYQKSVGIWNVYKRLEIIGNIYENPELIK